MARSTNKLSKTFVWILLGLLIIGLAGFGTGNFGGRANSVGSVGEKTIGVNEYVRALQNQINAASAKFGTEISFQQAQLFGIQQQALSRLVVEKTLENEADLLGISSSDETVHNKLMTVNAFQGVDGSFDRTAYDFALQNVGLSESEFEQQLRDEEARLLIQRAVLGGINMQSSFGDYAMKYFLEARAIAILELDETDLPSPIAVPAENILKTHYEENIDLFSLPKSKSITYVILTPEMLVDQISVEDDVLLKLYEKNIDAYKQPERRLVERLNYLDLAAAERAEERLKSGDVDFDGLVKERGLTLNDVDLGDVSRNDLGEASEAVFDISSGETTAVLETDMGAAIYRVNGILNAQEISFEEVREELKREFAFDQARRLIELEQMRLDDLLAAGATLEELERESEMSLETTIYYDGLDTGIASYTAFRSAAKEVTGSDFPSIIPISGGGILALRLNQILPQRPQDFDIVKEDVKSNWHQDALREALDALGNEKIQLAQNGEPLANLGPKYRTAENVQRNGNIADIPDSVVARAFELNDGEFGIVEGKEQVYVVQPLAITEGNGDSEQARLIKEAFVTELNQALANDLFQIFISQVQQSVGVTLNDQALNAVHTNLQ